MLTKKFVYCGSCEEVVEKTSDVVFCKDTFTCGSCRKKNEDERVKPTKTRQVTIEITSRTKAKPWPVDEPDLID